MKKFVLFLFLFFSLSTLYAQTAPQGDAAKIMEQILAQSQNSDAGQVP